MCTALLFMQLALMALRPVISLLPAPEFRESEMFSMPVFSVHVATQSEPPDLVIDTLRALLIQDFPQDHYEIIVMDNNTRDAALWKPVHKFCGGRGNSLKFLHRMGVNGAKAGALNIALNHTRADATHIVTVDADYAVTPDFLTAAATALARTGADYVQFPQSYVATSGGAAGVDAELEEYFRSNATVADGAEAVLLTGTLCVVSRAALIEVGGWSGATTTEDAELGVRLCNAGYSGRFIEQIVGQGLLPFGLSDLEKQRYRWCSGNFQTLLRHFPIIFATSGRLSLHKRLVLVSQLTAWCNLSLVPTVLLIAELLLGRSHSTVSSLCALIIILSFLDVVIRVVRRSLRDRLGLDVTARAVACRIALAPQSAKATIDATFGKKQPFVVTRKSGVLSAKRIPVTQLHLFMIAAVILISIPLASPLVIAALLLLMLPFPAAIITDKSLSDYRFAVSALAEEGAI